MITCSDVSGPDGGSSSHGAGASSHASHLTGPTGAIARGRQGRRHSVQVVTFNDKGKP